MANKIFSLEEEVRNDFVVSEKRKKIWKTQIEMALIVKRICEKHKIKYFIIWGTLLGAARHKGYIPWDDDFDIAFLRRDYDRFCQIARKEISSPFFFQDALSDRDYFIGYARIRNSRTTGWILKNPSPRYNNGIFIDLYPLDVIPKSTYIWRIQAFIIKYIIEKLTTVGLYEKNSIKYKNLCFLHRLSCTIFNGVKHPEKIGPVYSPYEIEEGYWFYAEDIRKTIAMAFENVSFSAPAGYQNILRKVYGNYMKFPPKGKRGEWHARQIIYEPDMPYQEFYKSKVRENKNK